MKDEKTLKMYSLLWATSQSRATHIGTQPGHNKQVTIDQAIAICQACRPRPHGPQPYHPCHRQIKAIISHHWRRFPCFGDLSVLDRPMLEIFRRQKLYYEPKTRFFILFLCYLLLYLLIYFILICSQRRDNIEDVISCLFL